MPTIRILALIATALVFCSVSASEPFYKWIEADGTLTFSRTPPAKDSGIKFEVVGSNQGNTKLSASQPSQPQALQATQQQASTSLTTGGQTIGGGSDPTSSTGKHIAPIHSKRKSTQCGELQKRVLSLERLLKTEISAETMDNAVVQMARYQNSFNQSCNRSSN